MSIFWFNKKKDNSFKIPDDNHYVVGDLVYPSLLLSRTGKVIKTTVNTDGTTSLTILTLDGETYTIKSRDARSLIKLLEVYRKKVAWLSKLAKKLDEFE